MSKQQEKGILLDVGTNEVEFLRFGILGQVFGINVAKVRQVMVYVKEQVTEIPGTPKEVLGQLLFRGNPIPVIDLSLYLKHRIPEDETKRLFLVCEFNLTTVAFIVDSVDRILRCSWKAFRPLEQSQFGQTSGSVVGTVLAGEEMIPIVDVELVLAELIPAVGMIEHDYSKDERPLNPIIPREEISIVYCEDSHIVQKVLFKTLESAGFKRIKMFGTAADGLEYLKSKERGKVDIIISDIEMPRMDGLTFCKELRSLQEFKEIPFVFFSSTVSEEMRKKCEQVGGSMAFSKPEIQNIVTAIDELVVAR